MDITCTVCEEIFISDHILLATSCGHVFHKDCLDNWTWRQKTCPQCRSSLEEEDAKALRIFLNFSSEGIVASEKENA